MKYAILSTDGTKEYFDLIPLACYSWKKLGYKPVVISVNCDIKELVKSCDAEFIPIPGIAGVKDSTVAQVARLFIAGEFLPDDILITSDADMVIAKDIFTDEGDIVSYGHDLTGRGDLPMCYVKAKASKWIELMKIQPGQNIISNIASQLSQKASSEKWEDYWETDQKLLTERARLYGFENIKFVDRGNNNKHGLPTGRWDRHDWAHVPSDIIDVHMKRNDVEAQREVFKRLWPEDELIENLK